MSHDQYFKLLIKGFFYEFLRLFLPAIAQGLDPASIEFVDTTGYTNQPDGAYRIADIAARARLREEQPALIILHTEIEAEPDSGFPRRMWEYNALFALEHRLPVISIALLPFMVGNGIELARYTESVLGQDYIKLEYWRIPVRGLDATEYLAAEPSLAIPLAALMRPQSASSVDLKTAIFARLRRDTLAPGTRALFFDFVQTYLQLSEEQEAEFLRRMAPEGDVTMETLERTWFDEQIQVGIAQHAPWADRLIQQGIERGLQQGIEQGVLRAKRESLILQVRVRFGEAPKNLAERLDVLDEPRLNRLLERVVQSASLEAFVAAIEEG